MLVFRKLLTIQNKYTPVFYRAVSYLYVRRATDEGHLHISFNLSVYGGKSRQFLTSRKPGDNVSTTLNRIEAKVKEIADRRKKSKQLLDADEISIDPQIFHESKQVSGDVLVQDAFITGAVVRICGTEFTVEYNPPTIKSVTLPKLIMVGFPIVPILEYEFTDVSSLEFVWSRIEAKELAVNKKKTKEIVTEVARTFAYTPSKDDIGCHLRLLVTPKLNGLLRDDRSVQFDSPSVVIERSGECPFEKRHLYTQHYTEPGIFRVVTYNILAEMYADSNYSRNVLFPYCPPHALEVSYRSQLLLKELMGYKSDIICLQEVDRKVFYNYLSPALVSCDLDGYYREKGGCVAEGSAIFFRRSRFKYVGQHDIIYTNALETDPECADIYEKTVKNQALNEFLKERHNALQVLVLECIDRPKQKLIVANTHLFFHPATPNIRLIQGIIAAKHLQKVQKIYDNQEGEVSMIFCGDFNTSPESGTFEFLTTQEINEDHLDWKSAPKDQFVPGMNFKHNLDFVTACGQVPYTNYVEKFQDTLDYIFYDVKTLEVEKVIPPPDHEDVVRHTAIPSVLFPSDHIAQVCELKWKF
ncbi:hypothetical protein ACJMK2_003191 [Sinanodonta woodiana]|uniref:2',5'-phosphodiesterase 12 n=1 Tax=Sinanodonta woodiana TaxID=1069815 RepID=A0ABD3Y0R8_SINWO